MLALTCSLSMNGAPAQATTLNLTLAKLPTTSIISVGPNPPGDAITGTYTD